MQYTIDNVSPGAYYVQYLKRGQWLYYKGSEHICFDTLEEAYDWIVEKKLGKNHVKALLQINPVYGK